MILFIPHKRFIPVPESFIQQGKFTHGICIRKPVKMTLLVFYLLLALLVSSFCSVAEAVLLSTRPSYVSALEQQGHKCAALLKKLTTNLDRPLAAILTANTIAHTIGAAGVGAQASVVFGSEYLGIVSAVLTLLILVISEIIPKSLGAAYWKSLAPTMAYLINYMILILYPFVVMSQYLTSKLAGGDAHGTTFSRSELEAMAAIGAHEGALDPREYKIVSNLLKLRNLSVRMIMTPRTVIFSLPAATAVNTYRDAHADSAFSRIPVHEQDKDDITGYVLKADLLTVCRGETETKPIGMFKRDFLALSDKLSVAECFDHLLHAKAHIALVVDEYGTTQGLVTMEDVFETIIGLEIMDESDTEEDMQILAEKRWKDRMQSMGIDPDNP